MVDKIILFLVLFFYIFMYKLALLIDKNLFKYVIKGENFFKFRHVDINRTK